jgi:Trk K+ transport system NAD-binding subunit
MTKAAGQHIVVFGFRGVARRIVKQLAKVADRVVVVDPELGPSELETLRRYGVEYVAGYGQSLDVLTSVDITHAAAAICATNDDLRNIEIALLMRELCADVRLVVQMANGTVGHALRSVTQPSEVLDVADLASIAFVEAAVQRESHPLMLGRRRFHVTTVSNPRDGRLREVWGDIAPIAVRDAQSGNIRFTPSRDDTFSQGDSVMLLGTEDEFRRIGHAHRLEAPQPRRRSPWSRMQEGLSAALAALDRQFRIVIGIIAGLAVSSVAVLTTGYVEPNGTKMSVLDAAYFTIETIATVGYGDFYFRGQSAGLRAWAILMMLMGATLVYTAVAFLTQALVSRRLEQSLGRQRVTGMRDHIIVFGLGAVGSHVALDLQAAGYEVVVIDQGTGQRFVPQMRAAGIPVLIGDPTLPETHRAAGVQRAAGIAVLSNDDLLNIETALAVRAVLGDRRVPVTMRVFGRNLARAIDGTLDIGITRSVAEMAAPWFVGAAMGLHVVGTFYVDEVPFMAARVNVRAGDGLAGRAIGQLSVSTRFMAIDRADGSFDHPLQRDTVLAAGDSVYVVGRFEDLLDLLRA